MRSRSSACFPPLVNSPAPSSASAAANNVTLPPAAPARPGRLVSLDALRGFDMFWILGGDALVHALVAVAAIAPVKLLAAQFEHKEWAGFAFYDLIFPLFVFVSGVSMVFSLTRTIEQHGRARAVQRVLGRTAVLVLVGIFYSGGFSNPWPDVRLLGVLQRIGLAYGGAGLLFCFLKPRALAVSAVVLLVGYWALLTWVPIRDVTLEAKAMTAQLGTAGKPPAVEQVRALYDATSTRVSGRYAAGLNVSNHFDFNYLPGRKYDTYFDPEGILSTVPAVVTCLLGVFAGLLLRRADLGEHQKVARLVGAGVLALSIGWLWHLQFPVVKKLWTSSFVLVAGGWSFLLLALFYYVVDVRRWRGWTAPFVWIGMNSITLYVLANLMRPRAVAQRFAGGSVKERLDAQVVSGLGNLVIAFMGALLVVAVARFLYRRQIFLRL